MTDSGDGPEAIDIPPTRKHEALEPAPRESHLSLENATTFPDDGTLSRQLRTIDRRLGDIEQGVLFALLAIIVVTASLAALSDKLLHHQLGRWWFTVVRGGTFSIAIFGAAFATQQQGHLAMDLVSRKLPPRGRLVLLVALELLTIAVCVLLFRSGVHQRATVGTSGEALSIFGMHITDKDVVTTIPIGAALIIAHALLHMLIDADYLARGKQLPERARSTH